MDLTERAGQLDVLVRRLTELLRVDGPPLTSCLVTVLTGPVGCGKTSLLQAFARRAAAEGVTFLGASASRAERTVPLEVIRQLVRVAQLDDDARDRVGRLLDRAALAWVESEDEGEAFASAVAATGGALLELAARGPLVIAVDDVHHADVPSLRCLEYVSRRVSGLAVLIVLTESPRTRPWHATVCPELMHPARLHRVRLPFLSPSGTYQVLAGRLGGSVARTIAVETHRITGGNPLLVQALADDHLAAGGRDDRPLVGEAFREAVLSCLYRCEHLVLKVARALAVTDEPLHGPLLPHLVHAPSGSALRAVDTATSAGLITEDGLRHPAAGQAILDGTTAEECARLHRAAAGLLHEDGAAPVRVAAHLVRTDEFSDPWMVQALLDAAEQALSDGEVDTAQRFLRRANRECTDESLRARIGSALARAEWRLDPQAAVPHLLRVATAVRAGHLGSRQAADPIQYLLWHGQVDKAVELIHHLGRDDRVDPSSAAELVVTKGWLSTLYPGFAADGRAPVVAARDRRALARVRQRLRGVTALLSVLERGDERAVAEAERTLATIRLDGEPGMWTGICALIALIYADRLDRAEDWCNRLTSSVTARHHPTPVAVLAALSAAIAVRRGDLPRARELAESALNRLSPKGWGVAIGMPLALRLRALTILDEQEEASACLQIPVPPALFETPFGLYYLHARGKHALTAGSPEAALADFQLCGQLMTSWRMDLPAFVPWRTESARALLRMGQRQQAQKLVREELPRLGPAHVRNRAAALRVLAATEDGPDRIKRLRAALLLLQECGDRMELAHCYTDLGHAYQQAGDARQARTAARTARALAQECGIPQLRSSVPAGGFGAAVAVCGLSDAEAQVATLAARGHTNREIAKQLFLTVSAIEQRLTRIYRKLDVDSRSELAARLGLASPARQ